VTGGDFGQRSAETAHSNEVAQKKLPPLASEVFESAGMEVFDRIGVFRRIRIRIGVFGRRRMRRKCEGRGEPVGESTTTPGCREAHSIDKPVKKLVI
jgi:hypothetical protein